MTLYEISVKYAALLDNLDINEETGELLNADGLDIAADEFDGKAENYALYIKNLKSTAEAIKTEHQKLSDRQKSIERKIEILTDRLDWAMRSVGKTKFETARVALSFRKSEAVSIIDESKIPAAFKREKVTVEPDKAKIKEAIKSGQTVDGAVIEERYNLNIR